MHQDAFKKLEPDEIAVILEKFNPLFEGSKFDPANTTIMAQKLSFYKGLRYLDIADYSCVPPMHRFVIEGKKHNIVLNWTNDPIYKLNKDVPIKLTDKNVCDYVEFFFDHVKGKNGRFFITENVDDIHWKDDPPPSARKSISKMLIPLALRDKTTEGIYQIPATVMFKNSLFQCEIHVSPDGMIKLDHEELLVEDMPVLDDIYGH